MSDLAAKKSALLAAKQAHAAALKASADNKEDAKLAAAVIEAANAVLKAQDEYAEALEKADPLTQSIEERLAKVRKEEKEKLYGSLEKQKQEKEEAEKRAKELEEKLKQMEEAAKKKAIEEENTEEGKKKKADNTEQLKALEERMNAALAKAEQEAAAVKMESEQRVAALQKELSFKEVETYKAQKLAELGSSIVPELVSGATKEDIDNSIIKARQARERIVKEIEAARAGAGDELKNRVPSILNPQPNQTQLTGTLTADQIRKMSPTEWAAHRKSLGFK